MTEIDLENKESSSPSPKNKPENHNLQYCERPGCLEFAAPYPPKDPGGLTPWLCHDHATKAGYTPAEAHTSVPQVKRQTPWRKDSYPNTFVALPTPGPTCARS